MNALTSSAFFQKKNPRRNTKTKRLYFFMPISINVWNVAKNLYPKKNERNHNYEHYDELEKIYCNLLEKMQNMDFITII